MKKKNESKMAAVLVSMGLCVVALGAGMTYYTWSNVKEPLTAEESPASPVTVAKSPTLDTAKAQREQMSNDDGELFYREFTFYAKIETYFTDLAQKLLNK